MLSSSPLLCCVVWSRGDDDDDDGDDDDDDLVWGSGVRNMTHLLGSHIGLPRGPVACGLGLVVCMIFFVSRRFTQGSRSFMQDEDQADPCDCDYFKTETTI